MNYAVWSWLRLKTLHIFRGKWEACFPLPFSQTIEFLRYRYKRFSHKFCHFQFLTLAVGNTLPTWLIPRYLTSAVHITSLNYQRTDEEKLTLVPDEPRLLKESSSLCRTNPYSPFSCGLIYATFSLILFENDALISTVRRTKEMMMNDAQRKWWWIELYFKLWNTVSRFYIFSRTQIALLMCLKCVQKCNNLTTIQFKVLLLSDEIWVWQIQSFNQIKSKLSALYYMNIIKTTIFISVWLHLYLFLLDLPAKEWKLYDS